MKRFLGILSLIIVVGTEVLTPITYANDLVLNEEVYQSVDSNISDIPENDNVAGDQNNVSGDNNFSDDTDEDAGEQGSLSSEGEENDGTLEQTETDEKDNQEQTETEESDTQEQTETNSVTATEDEQGTDTVQCEDAILHGIYDEECVFQEKCEEGYVLEENECVLSEDIGSDLGENEETVEENKEEESSSAVVVEDTDFSFIDSLSDIAKEIIGGLRYFFTRDSDSFIKYSTSGDEGIIVLIDPENGDSMTIMDKNLGAESTSEEDEKSYGNYYQWGSNNGISGDKIADFIENEEVNSTGDWNGDDEEIQGPCPTGYHIPTQNEWNDLVNVWRKIHTQDVRENVDDEGVSTVIRKTRSTKGSILLTSLEKCNEGDVEVEGKCIAENEISGLESLFMSDLKLPKAGSYSANGEYRDGVGSYWTVTPSENVTTQSEIFSIDKYFGKGIYDDEKDRTSWHNVRCFLDTKVKESVVEDNLNKEEIVGELEYDGVVVKVIAPVGSFYEGTEPRIKVISEDDGLDDVKDEIAGSQDNVSKESKMVAFDISFMYKVGTGEIEVQPVEGKTVKVLFDYKLNDDFLNAETDENQEVKVFHLEETKETTEEDIDSEQGEIVEEVKTTVVDVTNEEESSGTGLIVADGESFSIYVLTLVENNSDIITLDGNGGMLDDDTNIVNLECDNETNICTGDISSLNENIVFPNATRQHAVFLGWIGSGTDTGLDSLTKNPVLSTGIVAGHTYKAKYTCDYGYVDIDNVCVLLADAPATGLVYDSESQTITVWGNVNGTKMRYTIQDRNVGATETGAYNVYTAASRGKYFQYGNNNGLYKGQSTTFLNSSVDVGNVIPSTYSGNLTDINKFPYVTNNGTGYLNIWGYFSKDNDWQARRGPCDEGYHVPSDSEATNLIKALGGTSRSGLLEQLWMPGVGWGYNNGSTLGTAKDCEDGGRCQGKYQQSKIQSVSTRSYFRFESGQLGTVSSNDANRYFPVRCFQDYANCSQGQIKQGLNCLDYTGSVITFDAGTNGGISGDAQYLDDEYEFTLDLSNYTAEKPGYYFVGWNEDKDANRGLTGEYAFMGSTTLYAIFLKLYTYTFEDTEGNILGTGYYESGVVSDMTKLIPSSYYLNEGYDTSSYEDLITLGVVGSGKGWRWFPELPSDGIATGDLVLQGELDDAFTYNFLDINGDSYYSGLILSGGVINEPANPGKQGNYQFISWYEDSGFNTEFDFSTNIVDNITIYPKFKQLYCTFTTEASTLGGLKITGFDGEQSYDCLTHFVVPSEINGEDVVEIANSAFMWTGEGQIITGEVNFPDSILRIGDYAFKNNDISGSFRFPKNLAYLEAEAFYGNDISGTIKFPSTIISKMMGSAFRCNLVEKVIILEGVLQVNQNAYNTTPCPDRATLTSVEFPSTLTKILHDAFYGQNIQGVDLPDGLTFIGASAFYNNSISGELVLPSSLITIDSLAFYNNISGTLVIPGSISTVTTAFRCNPIREVVFGEGVKKIDHSAFSSDLGNNVCPEGKGRTIKSIDLPDSLEEIGENAFLSQKIEGEFVFPASLTKLGVGAFKNNNISGTLRIPGNYGSGNVNGAFKCNLIEKVIFSEGIRIIGDQAFYANDTNCSKDHFTIKSVEFPSTLTGINYNAFRDHQLSSVTIGENVEKIGHNAFDNQHDSSGFTLKTVLLRGGTTLENNAFISNDMESIYIPDSIESFGTDVFKSSGNTYITGYVTTKKSTLNYTGAYIKPVYQLYTYTFVDETGTVLGTGYYPEILESNTTKLIPLDYYNGVGDISTFTSVDSLINPGAGHVVRWSTELSENSVVTQNLVVTGIVEELHSVTFDIIWKNEDGTVLETDAAVEYGVTPLYNGATPQKSGDAQYTYTFAGWTPELTGVTENAVYTAKYTETLNKYTVAFVDDDGREILSKEYNYGTASGDIELPADPTKESTAQYTYHFAGWTPELVEVTENAVYTAVYNPVVNQYTIIFNDEDGTELGSGVYNYGTASGAIKQPETPTKDPTPEYTFTFAGWNPELTGVTEAAVYTATYTETLNTYVVTYDKGTNKGTVETETSNVDYGTLQLTGAGAEQAEREGYQFIGWATGANQTGVVDSYLIDSDKTFYAVYKKIGSGKDITIHLNGNTGFVYNDVTYNHDQSFSGCKFKDIYNLEPESTECNFMFTLPAIGAPEATPHILGWTTGSSYPSDGVELYTVPGQLSLTGTLNSELHLYAQTKSDEKTYTITYATDNKVNPIGITSDSCTIPSSYNGVAQSNVCPDENAITLPSLTAKQGYNTPVWTDGETNRMPGAKISLGVNLFLTGTASPNEATSYIVKHYFQLLSGDNTLSNRYQLSGTDTGLSGTTEQVLVLSSLAKDESLIPGYSYSRARVNGEDVSVIDLTDISIFDETGAIDPDGNLIIKLFYTRKSYYYTENSVEHASIQRSPLSDSYYYGQNILFTGVADEGYSFSGFTINNVDYNTSVLNYEVGTSGIEVTPEIREHTYTVHFNGNGATEGSVSDVTGYYSDIIQLPSNTVEGNKFEKLGYHFMGWFKAGESTILEEITKGTPDDNGEITLYAQWEENATGSYRVEYYTEPVEGGTEENYQLYSSGTYSADTHSVVTGARIEITGFDIPDEKTGIVLSDNSLVIKYYYPRHYYTFTFNAGDGAIFSDGSTSTGVNFKYGRQVIFPTELDLIKTGFTFASWNPVLGVMPADNSSSIAQWNENHYTIKFNANGGIGTMEDISSVAYTENKLLSTNTFTRNGYTFLGWSKNQGATVSTYNDGTTVNRLTDVDNGGVILYAVWSKDTYTITYDLAGGALDDGASNKESYTVTDSDFTLNNPKKDGYTFKGWQESSSEEIIETVTIAQGSTGSKYFVARWTPIMYSISYDLDGGSLKPGDSNPLEYSIESGSIEIKNPVKNGYTFRGWTGTDLEELSGTLVIPTGSTGNRSYIAKWTINQYKASFLDESGTLLYENYFDYNTIPQYGGSEPSKPADQQYTYTFGGWNPTPSAITEDSVYTATYDSTLRQYTITFKNDDGTELKKETLNYGSGIVPPTATKPATAQYTYHFAGWNPELPEGATVSGDAVYTATYTETTNTYKIIWKNEDGTVLETDAAVAYGTTPVYNGETPQKDGDAQYSYHFDTWSPAVSQVVGNATYTATYTQETNVYTAIFNNYDGEKLFEVNNILYGTVPTYGGSTPVRPQDERYIYTFNNTWSPSLEGITGDTTYVAQYDKEDRLYTITFKDGDEESSNTYLYMTATGDLKIPNRSKTGHTLVWQPDLSPVVQDQVYTASYVRNSYKVSTLAETGVDHIDGSGTYLYEAEVTFTGYAKTGYHFDDGDTVLTHTFNVPAYDSIVKMNANPNIYKVRYLKNGGVGTAMADQTFTYDETGVLAVNTFVKTGSYFKGWLDEDNNMYSDGQEVINLTGEDNGIVLLIAQWSDTAKHTLKVIDTDGSILQTKLYSSGDIISLDTPTKKGYLFVEWTNYPESGLMPDRDIEIGVVWKVNPDDQGQSSGQSGGGGGRVVPKEDKVIIPEEEHGAAQESGSQEVVQPKETDKDNDLSLTLYQWAYKYGITTKREDESNPDGVLLRGHMAKIIVNYVVNVLGRKEPKVIPDRCSFIDNEIDWKSEEIKQYSKRACALGLMGINVETFNSNAVVTRAQFGTVLSRVLWGDTYNLTGTSYYDLHLKALKRKGIMTKIDHPINVVEIRKWARLMLRRAYEDYEIKD